MSHVRDPRNFVQHLKGSVCIVEILKSLLTLDDIYYVMDDVRDLKYSVEVFWCMEKCNKILNFTLTSNLKPVVS